MTTTKQLKDIATLRNGYLNRKKLEPAEHGPYALIQLRDFNAKRTVLDKDHLFRFEPGTMRCDQTVHERDVLFLAKGAHPFAFYPGALSYTTLAASYFFILTPAADLLPDYLVWFLNHPDTMRIFKRISGSGVRVPVIRKRELEEICLPLPPLETQKAIVELTQTAQQEASLLDQLKQERKRLINLATMELAAQHNEGKES